MMFFTNFNAVSVFFAVKTKICFLPLISPMDRGVARGCTRYMYIPQDEFRVHCTLENSALGAHFFVPFLLSILATDDNLLFLKSLLS